MCAKTKIALYPVKFKPTIVIFLSLDDTGETFTTTTGLFLQLNCK
jgi:hypothetical protein